MKLLLTYTVADMQITVVRALTPSQEQLFADPGERVAFATNLITVGSSLQKGDLINGQPVTDQHATKFFRPTTVAFINS